MTTTAVAKLRRPNVDTVDVVLFRPEGDRARYDRFHEVRVEVFGRSLGWQLPPSVGPWHDAFDKGARCAMAETGPGEPIGILRSLVASTAFPHRELFEPHLERCSLQHRMGLVGTINALAVLPQFRRRTYCSSMNGGTGTAARLLLRSGLDRLAADGVRVVLATVAGCISARAFLGVGFRLLDMPRSMPGQATFVVANVGAVLPPTGRRQTPDLQHVRAYFDECHRRVSAAGRLCELFAAN